MVWCPVISRGLSDDNTSAASCSTGIIGQGFYWLLRVSHLWWSEARPRTHLVTQTFIYLLSRFSNARTEVSSFQSETTGQNHPRDSEQVRLGSGFWSKELQLASVPDSWSADLLTGFLLFSYTEAAHHMTLPHDHRVQESVRGPVLLRCSSLRLLLRWATVVRLLRG